MANYTLNVNNQQYTVDVDEDTPVLWVLRDQLNLVGTKFGCGVGQCGSCTIHFNGNPMRSCILPVSAVGDGKIVTIEGLSEAANHPVQLAWKELDVPQCGYCQAGQMMSAAALLDKNQNPTLEEIHAAMHGNICRCGTYNSIEEAIRLAAKNMTEESK